ncbi:helix-turn-helix domain-containing protein [Pantoea phytobeneficialis]|uniref:Transcriptional regulator n=1 Tax=Pantoea phytobeneficialis TaxID=2052056 RepID=A0AAP9KSF3_9GAMM|nr:XRE family transcriptional regulator [Pantoea phytobeneficialis]MDO6407058.1 XRE family transcriptional regulator [Pantoea phytobeneficialis]QGR10018.1 transcriptional regulator [Pantoea phytobeneficialis]
MKTLNDLKAGLSAESLARIDKKVSEMRLESQLYKLREALDRTQREQAAAMGIAQPSVVAIESRGEDLKIATLKRYVEALGGQLTIGVNMPGGEHVDFTL